MNCMATAAAIAMISAMVTLADASTTQGESLDGVPDMTGRILTVAGPIDPSEAQITLVHEHIFDDFKVSPPMLPPPTGITVLRAPGGETAAPVRQRGGGLTDFDVSLAEITEFKRGGGQTIVDVTNFGLTRDPEALLLISRVSGLHIVMGAGWYQKEFHPPDMAERTVAELTDIVVRDITVGAQGTSVRAGIIGEVGINGNPLTANEIKSIRACARAARLTGAPMMLHSFAPAAEMMQALDIIASEGVDMNRVVMAHRGGDITANRQFFERGVYVEWDYMAQSDRMAPERADAIAKTLTSAIDAGFVDQILMSHDIASKPQLKKNGGGGYSYIATMIVPALRARGVSGDTIRQILIDNPRRMLTFVRPQSQVSQMPASARGRS